MKRNLISSTVLLALLLLCASAARVSAEPGVKRTELPNRDFALKDLTGRVVHFSDYRGKVVVLNFWATWCQPCRVEIPWFIDLQKRYGPQGLQIIGISMDESGPQKVAAFASQMGINYPILLGEGDVHGVDALPITLYCNRDGRIIGYVPGLVDREEIERTIKEALAGVSRDGRGTI